METSNLLPADSEHDAHRTEVHGAAPVNAHEPAPEADGWLPGRVFGGAPGDPPGAGVTRLMTSPALSHSANSVVRAAAIQRAQRTHGNRYVQRLVSGFDNRQATPRARFVQRACSCGGTCAKCQAEAAGTLEAPAGGDEVRHVQARSSGGDTAGPDAGVTIPSGGGDALDTRTRGFMESRFGEKFDDVRVHTDTRPSESAGVLNADAYTSGRDVYFAAGKYAPETDDGRHLLAHELSHTVQQGPNPPPGELAARGASHVVVGASDDPMEKEAELAADAVTSGGLAPVGGLAPAPDSAPVVRRQPAGADAPGQTPATAPSLWDRTGGRLVKVGGEKLEEAAEAVVERLAPGLLPFLKGVGSALVDMISSGVDSLFGGLVGRIRQQGLGPAIAGVFTDLLGRVAKRVTSNCAAIPQAAHDLGEFIKSVGGPVVDKIGSAAKAVGGFFEDVYKKFIAPGLESLGEVAGAVWSWIKKWSGKLWDWLKPLRDAAGKAWDWIKRMFNLAVDQSESAFDWLVDHAHKAWDKVREKLAPIIGPLKVVAAAIVLLSPLGPIVVLAVAAPHIWGWIKDLGQWAAAKWHDSKMRAYLRDVVLPGLLSGVSMLTGLLDRAAAFLCGHAAEVASALQTLERGLGTVPGLGMAAKAVGFASEMFASLAAKGSCKFSDLVAGVKGLLHSLVEMLQPVLEALRQIALLALFGPYSLFDDGVWNSFLRVKAFIQKTPCLREIAGLLQFEWIVGKLGAARSAIKGVWEKLNDPKYLEAKISEALGGLVALLPGKIKSLVGLQLFPGPHAAVHLEGLMRHLEPKIAQMLGNWKGMAVNAVKAMVWPWPTVIEGVPKMVKSAGDFINDFANLHFSKAVDDLLAIWRALNEVVGALFGWFSVALILGSTIAGALAGGVGAVPGFWAGVDAVEVIGAVLIESTIAAEALSIKKSQVNLVSGISNTPEEKEADYEVISNGSLALGILYVMMVVGELAVNFLKAVWAEVKGLFKPRPPELPGVKPTAGPATEAKPPEVANDPAAPKDAEPPLEDVMPPEEAARNLAKLEERAADPKNIKRVTEPDRVGKYDAEVDLGDHTAARPEGEQTVCFLSTPKCGFDPGAKVNAEMDAAVGKDAPTRPADVPPEGAGVDSPKAAEPTSTAETPPPPESPPSAREASAKDIARDATNNELKKVGSEIDSLNERINDLQRKVSEAGREVNRLKERAKNTTGEEHANAVKEFQQARDALTNEDTGPMDELKGAIEARQRLREVEERLNASLKLDRPPLRESTKNTIKENAVKEGGKFIEEDTGKVIEGEYHYGHRHGFEHRRLALKAQSRGMNQTQFNDWVNQHPEWFQIETPQRNLSHAGEKPGIDGWETIGEN